MDKVLKIFHQTSWQVLGKAATSLSTVVILSLITRNFGEIGTGIFTLSLTYLAFFTLAVDLGINAYLLSRFTETEEQIFKRCLGLRMFLAAFLTMVALAGINFWPQSQFLFKQLVFLGAVFAIFEPAIFITTNLVFQKHLAYQLSVRATILGSAVTLLGVILVSSKGLGLIYLMFAYILGWIVMATVSLISVRKFITNLSPVFDLQFMKEVFIKSWPISLTLLLNVVYFRLDSFLLSFLRPISEVGIYNLAYQIFQTILVLPTFIMNSFYPLMLLSFSQDKLKFIKELKLSIRTMIVLGLLASLVTFFLSPVIISIITGGKGFVGSSYSLQILALGFPAFFISSVLMWTFVTLKKYKLMLVIYLAGLIFNFLANYLFIPKYSYIASSYITGISEYLILLLQLTILIPLLSKLKK